MSSRKLWLSWTMPVVILTLLLASVMGCAGGEEGEVETVSAHFTASPTSGACPLTVQFTNQSTGEINYWEWDFDNDGTVDSTQQKPSHTYHTAGKYTVSLKVTGPDGSDTQTKTNYIEAKEAEGPVSPEAGITLTGPIEIFEGASDGTISLTISEDGSSLVSVSVTLSDLECNGFSSGSITKSTVTSIAIAEGAVEASVGGIGQIEGEFTSPTEASGSIHLTLEIPFVGTCELGTWNWSAQKTSTVVDITGTWSGDWWRSDGGEEGTLIATLTQSGSSLSGDMTITSTTFSYSRDTTVSGSVQGNEVVFGTAIGGNGSTVTIDYEGTVAEDGDQMSGTYSMSTGYTGTWSVTRE
jgi:PKD repeat protein